MSNIGRLSPRVVRTFAIPAIFAFMLLPMSAAPAQTNAQKEDHKMTLRAIMSELGAEYLRLTNALLIDDFKGLEESAKAIQSHPLPDELVATIKKKLGKSFRAFERADQQSHHGAADLARRAAAKDIVGSAKAFGTIADGCVSCHNKFRATLKSLSD
jgi:hypothetical protein